METKLACPTGWAPMPIALKTLFILTILWSLGSAMNLPNLMENGLPLLGQHVHGLQAFLVVLALDFIGPLLFLYALWKRKPWGPVWAFCYIGLFILNGAVTLVTVRDEVGLMPILIPNLVYASFMAVIFWKRKYFNYSLISSGT